MIAWPKFLSRKPSITIETERFTLRTVDRRWLARESLAWSNDEELVIGLGWPLPPYTLKRWRRNFWRSKSRPIHHFGIFTQDGTLIGSHGLDCRDDGTATSYVAIGDRAWWGRNVVVEVRTAILDHVFGRADIHRVFGQVNARNFASVFNYQALGFTHEGTMRGQTRLGPGQHADLLIFGLLKEEWLERRTKKDRAT